MSVVEPRAYDLKDGGEVVVRSASPDDAPALLAHTKDIVGERAFMVTAPEEFTLTEEAQRRWIIRRADHPTWVALTAYVGPRSAGFLHLDSDPRKRLEHCGVVHMSVAEEYRGRGVGTALMRSVLDYAAKSPILEKVCLSVFAQNHPAIGLYLKVGFEQDGYRKKIYKSGPDEYADEILMSRCVERPGSARSRGD